MAGCGSRVQDFGLGAVPRCSNVARHKKLGKTVSEIFVYEGESA